MRFLVCTLQPDLPGDGNEGRPVEVRTHDFKDKKLGHAIPYGILDLIRDEGWVNVGISHDTAQFAVASIRGWWRKMGRERYPGAPPIFVGRRQKLSAEALAKADDRCREFSWMAESANAPDC